MRYSIILSLLLLHIFTISSAQNTTWPAENASWHVERTMPHGLLLPDENDPNILHVINGMLTTQIYYELGGLITIDEYTYTELWQDYESTFESLPSSSIDSTAYFPLTGAPQLRGAFRSEDSKVFFLELGSAGEQLLYDFDLTIGDTIPQSFINNNSHYPTVSSIDTVFIEGESHRRFSLEGTGIFSDVIIEGVGNKNGPIQELGIGFEINHRLLCYSQNDIPSYPIEGNNCASATGVEDMTSLQQKSIVYPNPSSGTIEINTPAKLKLFNASLYNSYGQQVKTLTPLNSTFQVSRDGLSPVEFIFYNSTI